uniref:HSA domain-containing protein n=1 Tax=Panagrellus redivivus TaxID=6233 RepID=A0A7E4WA75_PANRE
METPPAPPAPMTVPTPSLNSESAPTFNPKLLPSQEVHIAKLQNTITAMEEQNMTSDPRYKSLTELKERILNNAGTPTADNGRENEKENKEKKGMDSRLINQFKAQLAAFRHARNNSNIPADLLSDATTQLPIKKPANGIPMPFEIPGEADGEKIPYDLAKLHQMMLVKSYELAQEHSPPTSIDPKTISKERQTRINSRIVYRIKELSELSYDLPQKMRTRAEIELRGLRLINIQAAVRRNVLHALKTGATVEQSLNANAYRRDKKHNVREARGTDHLETQQRMEQERRRRQRHMEFLQQTIQASKDFREFHRNNAARLQRVRKAVATFHANSERERKKNEQKNEQLRMQKLMQEDEEGYRQLLDEKKDKRLVYLLQQTDEYVESLTGLVRQHQKTEKTRKKRERQEARVAAGIVVRNCVTGEVLKPEESPSADELETWLETHPGFEVVSRDAASDSDSDDERVEVKKPELEPDEALDDLDEETRIKRIIEKARNEEDEYDQRTRKQMESYYATAHKIKEKVVKQHSTMGGGDPNLQLKPYQIKGLEWMVSLYNNNLNDSLADYLFDGSEEDQWPVSHHRAAVYHFQLVPRTRQMGPQCRHHRLQGHKRHSSTVGHSSQEGHIQRVANDL